MTGGRILVIGDVVTDIVAVHTDPLAVDADTLAQIRIGGGGSGANTAAWLAWTGADVDLLSVVGQDAAGDDRLAELAVTGVGCALIRRVAQPTGSVIVLAQAQVRTMLSDRGANSALDSSDVDRALTTLSDLSHIHLSGYTLLDDSTRAAGLHALAAAAESGVTTSVDAAAAAQVRRVGGRTFLDWVQGAGLLFANLDEAQILAESTVDLPETVALILARAVPSVVVKLGSSGAVWASGDRAIPVPAEPAAAVDTTGAGDAFAAGLLAGRLAGFEIEAALAAAVRLAAHAVGIVGGRPDSRGPVSSGR